MEFLAGSHRDSVLKLGAAHLDHILEFDTFGPEGLDEVLQALYELPVHPDECIAES